MKHQRLVAQKRELRGRASGQCNRDFGVGEIGRRGRRRGGLCRAKQSGDAESGQRHRRNQQRTLGARALGILRKPPEYVEAEIFFIVTGHRNHDRAHEHGDDRGQPSGRIAFLENRRLPMELPPAGDQHDRHDGQYDGLSDVQRAGDGEHNAANQQQ